MKRRSLLKTLSLGFGYTISGIGLATLAVSCKQESGLANEVWKPEFLVDGKLEILENILDAMLPDTDSSPGFKSVGAINMVDKILSRIYDAKEQGEFTQGFDQIVSMIQNGGKDATTNFMNEYMSVPEEGALEKVNALLGMEDEELSEEELKQKRFYGTVRAIRDLGISTYFQNETIGLDYLNYDPVPGVYAGCIDVAEVGNNWSLR